MKNLNDAIQSSKMAVMESKAERVDREHAQVLEVIKAEFGISNFANESQSTKKAIRALVLEMWNPSTGLTPKGARMISEGVTKSLTEDSTPEHVEKYVKTRMKTACRSFVNGIFSKADLIKEYSDVVDYVLRQVRVKGIKEEDINRAYCESLALVCRTELKARLLGVK